MSRPARDLHVGLSAVLLLLGFLVSTGFVQERIRERELPERTRDLARLAASRRATVSELRGEVERLSGSIEEARSAVGGGSTRLRRLRSRLAELSAAAGTRELAGAGVIVEVADSERPAATRQEEADLRVQDVDLQQLVNALWAAGAEAVSVNGRRVVTTTAIRAAGGSIQVNYGAVTGPYRIAAVGDPVELRRGLASAEIAQRFQVWTQVYGLRYGVRSTESLVVPALPTEPEVRVAVPERP